MKALSIGDRVKLKLAEWEEKKHPRANDGKFGSGGGGEAAPEKSGKDEKPGGDEPAARKVGANEKDIDASVTAVQGAIKDKHWDGFNDDFEAELKSAPVEELDPDEAKKVFTSHKFTFDTDPDNDGMHGKGKENRGKETTDPSVLIRYGDKLYALDGQHRLNRAIETGKKARVVVVDGKKYEKYGLTEEFFEGKKQRLAKGKTMNLGKLVRAKMKELSADLSGGYLDNQGKHFELAADGEGYTVSYGGDSKKKISVTREVGAKLASASKKLAQENDEGTKRLAKSTKDILAIANQVEAKGAGFFQRAGKDMIIVFRGDSPAAFSNARAVATAIGSQASSPKADRIHGQVEIRVKDAYESAN